MEKMTTSGFVNVLKPTGMTSSDVVCKIKKILNTKKVGHLGTLDPAASGVLPISVGKATKFFDYFLTKEKEYFAIAKFGIETDTLDSFGKIVNEDNKNIDLTELESVLGEFIGEINQIPPKYSAIKIDGKKACDLARNDIDFEIKPRVVQIKNIEIIEKVGCNTFLFKVNCSAGTYIRTLLYDIAKKLGTIATVPVIIRSKSGRFGLESAVTLEELEQNKKLLSIQEIFSDMEFIEVDDIISKKLINGVKINFSEILKAKGKEFFICTNGSIIGLYKVENDLLKRIVFLYEN